MSTLSNLFSTIKNGYLAKKTQVIQLKSKQSIRILTLLTKEGFIRSFKITKLNSLIIYLKYRQNIPALTSLKMVSKPGRRIYIKNKELYLKKHGFFIISTSFGLKMNFEAKKMNLGGELICKLF